MVKICLAFPKARTGGSFVFLRNFQAFLQEQGYPCTDNLDDDYDVLFLNSWTIPYQVVLREKQRRPHLRVVQRVDGSAQDYGRRDGADWLQRDVNALADLTIFQSQYSYEATYERYRLIRLAGPVIHNPVDVERFSPEGERFTWDSPGKKRVISVGWSPNPMKGNWRIPILAQQNPDVEFLVVGHATSLEDLPNIRAIPYLEHDKLPKALRSADVYLSLILNDACPNVILEALASGLPIVYVPSGGVPELVRDAGLAFEADHEFPHRLDQLMADRTVYANRARQIALDHHHPDQIFPRYLAAIELSERRQLPTKWVNLRGYVDYQVFEMRGFFRKWGRILSGKQPLRKTQV
jgi:glycosyltransferase involved in cell wall biosynthesis